MRTSAMVRLAVMGVLLIALMIPLTMTHSVVSERATRRNEAASEISRTWGGPQIVGGPVLVIPYRSSYTDNAGRVRQDVGRIFVLPESLAFEGTVTPDHRSRGLFQVIVYQSRLKARGHFGRLALATVRPRPDEILWEDASVSIGISDPKGIGGAASILWNGKREPLVPGVSDVDLFAAGVQAPARGLSPALDTPVPFEFELDLKGTRELRFLPGGNETTVRLTSAWPHPSFVGAPLPWTRRVDAAGFDASWRVPYFGRGYPPLWTSATPGSDARQGQAAASAFGVTLIEPVDIYLQSERAVKYAALFIVLTFVLAFLWEVTSGVLVHPIQYLFVGFAMCVFYLLLVSLAEHVRFDPAYVVASACTIGLIAWYWSWVLGGDRHGAMMGLALSVLYGYLLLLLRLEDFALLAGSVGLFLALGLLMFMTRRVNWYELRLGVGTRGSGGAA